MGYRPAIIEIEYKPERDWYGTKLYGYVDDTYALESCKYLLEIGAITDDYAWGYGCDGDVVLTAKEFREWIRLYDEDLKREMGYSLEVMQEWEKLKRMIDSDNDKLIQWG